MTIFEDAKENGDQVIAILISSNLSGHLSVRAAGSGKLRF